MADNENIEGNVIGIIFSNPENGYTVFSVEMEDEEVICTGILPGLSEGERVKLKGSFVMHPTYGRQFSASQYEKDIPEVSDAASMERYLSSGVIKGIGAKMAAKIVGRFGSMTFEVIESYPEKLAEIRGISPNKAMEISGAFHDQSAQRNAMMFLQGYGITPNLANKIYKHYKERTMEVLKTNPYDIANVIDGVGFKTADGIAYKIGIEPENLNRIKAGIRYTLLNCVGSGHVFYPLDLLMDEASKLLEVPVPLAEAALKELRVENAVVLEKYGSLTAVYLNGYFYAESYVAKKLLELSLITDKDKKDYTEEILKTCGSLNITLAENQMEAVKGSLTGGVLVITGGPGTGKTTTINAIISMLKNRDMEIVLAAPTGRAAKRMTEATGMEANTIHRLLEVKYVSEDARRQTFEKNEDNPILADVVIIDEISMVDIMLMHHLLKAVEQGTRLILVGDADQLPSVGPGNVLKDIISAGCLNVIYLNEIFRQASMSDIVINAHNINSGLYPSLDGGKDFFLVKRLNIDNVVSAVLELVSARLPKFSGLDMKDIQVLTPMRKSKLGVYNLNLELQKVLNPPAFGKKEYEFRDFVFREGDKVMQIKNNYNITWTNAGGNSIYEEEGQGVFNGDEGFIERINFASESMVILFDDGRKAEYDFSQLDEIEPAYAITIHKSQGSEYKVVVIPVHSGPPILLNRNLLYTAVTRAREMVVLVGTEDCVKSMVDNDREIMRYSALDKKIAKFGRLYK